MFYTIEEGEADRKYFLHFFVCEMMSRIFHGAQLNAKAKSSHHQKCLDLLTASIIDNSLIRSSPRNKRRASIPLNSKTNCNMPTESENANAAVAATVDVLATATVDAPNNNSEDIIQVCKMLYIIWSNCLF